MNENPDREMNDFMREISDALGHKRKDKKIRGRRVLLNFKPQRKVAILVGAGIVLSITLIVIFSRGNREHSTEAQPSIQARLNQFEKRITRLEGIEERTAFLERQEKDLMHYVEQTDRSGRSLAEQLDKLTKKVGRLEKTITTVIVETGPSLTSQRRPFPLAKGRYHEVRSGDTLYWIAQQYGTSVEELCRLNNITSNQFIYPGQRLLVARQGNQ
jgi:uncharacterized coiled-coil protein SlyX